ncbi:hypothetical protein FJ656_12095, partial [Schumannella luteola]
MRASTHHERVVEILRSSERSERIISGSPLRPRSRGRRPRDPRVPARAVSAAPPRRTRGSRSVRRRPPRRAARRPPPRPPP